MLRITFSVAVTDCGGMFAAARPCSGKYDIAASDLDRVGVYAVLRCTRH
jgi:hypothetical protein